MENKNQKNLPYVAALMLAAVFIYRAVDAFSLVDVEGIAWQGYVGRLIQLVTAVFGILYVFVGCNKSQGKTYYSLFVKFMIINNALLLADGSIRESLFQSVPCVITLVILAVLAFVPNLGKEKSYILSIANFAVTFIWLILCALLLGEEIKLEVCISMILMLFLAASLFIFVIAKYANKAERNAK